MQRSAYAIGLLAATVLAGAVLLWPASKGPPPPQSGVSAPLAGAERPLRPVGPEEGIPPPSFDIVRIEPTGVGAASGRAASEARVFLRADGGTVATADADSRGEWALLIGTPLAPGDHSLTLLAALPDGRGMASREAVIVSIPERPAAKPLVVLRTPDIASEVMQSPGGPSARALSVDAVDLNGADGFLIGGRAEPGTTLNLYLDNGFIGGTTADGEGRWSLKATKKAPATGAHRIRLDALATDEFGAKRVAARLDVLFERKTPVAAGPGLKVESEAEGWRIEGEGKSLTVIYGASAARALDPTLAYPGQIIEPPPAAAATAMPAADR